jgi:hypothetical protein
MVITLLSIVASASENQTNQTAANSSGKEILLRIDRTVLAKTQTILILHTPTYRSYALEFSPKRLDDEAPFKLAISTPQEQEIGRELFSQISDIGMRPLQGEPAMRWGFIFLDEKGNRVLSVYVDKSGRRGFVNEGFVEFQGDSLFKWAEKKLGDALR